MQRKKVVVVGSSVAGSMTAQYLEAHFDVTLIDSKEYHEIRWATLRAMVDPKVADRIIIPHLEYLRSSKVIAGVVKSCTENEVATADGNVYQFDYLIIATDTKPEPPIPFQDRVWYFHKIYKQIASSESVLVVGGGQIGVEFAAEVATEFPGTKITLVHSGDRLVQFMKPKASQLALTWLQKKGVNVILNDRVKIDLASQSTGVSGTFQTARGLDLTTDFLFVAIGRRPHTSWLSATFGEQIDENGRVKVDEYFRLNGHTHIYAVGDVTNIVEQKNNALAHEHAKKCSSNLKLFENEGEDCPTIKPYVPTPEMAIVSLGRSSGVAQLPLPVGTVCGFIPAMLRSKHLFVEKTRKELGLNF